MSRARPIVVLTALAAASLAQAAVACPFCTVRRPTLCQQREAARVVALAELGELLPDGKRMLRVHRIVKGAQPLSLAAEVPMSLRADGVAEQGDLVLLFGTSGRNDATQWSMTPISEAGCLYFARAPSLRDPAGRRLKYFARHLEDADADVAEDAYLEFAHAPLEAVVQVSSELPTAAMRDWLVSPNVPPHRQGFYGMALGLATGAEDRTQNRKLLEQAVTAPASDFRSGFDGIVAGYLMLSSDRGLALIQRRFVNDPQAAEGDVRHVLVALRFYREHGKHESPERICAVVEGFLQRRSLAASAIEDLARWRYWAATDKIAALYTRPAEPSPELHRAIVGYLKACPEPLAREHLNRLRSVDPAGIAEAEKEGLNSSG